MTALLDTNAYVALVRGHREVAAKVRDSEAVLLSAVVLGELLAGFRHGSRERENRRTLTEFLDNPYFREIPVTRSTAEHFAAIWASLRRRGQPIPTNDVWIAAHALEHRAELISFDRHFAKVDGLLWSEPGG